MNFWVDLVTILKSFGSLAVILCIAASCFVILASLILSVCLWITSKLTELTYSLIFDIMYITRNKYFGRKIRIGKDFIRRHRKAQVFAG